MTAEQAISVARGGADYAWVAVRGRIDDIVPVQLRGRLDALMGSGARYFTVDLSDLILEDQQMIFDVLSWAEQCAVRRAGWLLLVGVHRIEPFRTRGLYPEHSQNGDQRSPAPRAPGPVFSEIDKAETTPWARASSR